MDPITSAIPTRSSGGYIGYTATRQPVQLVWFQEFQTREEAKATDAQIKKWSRRKKVALIGGNVDELKRAARKDWSLYRKRRGENS
jgi:predicted GIY-YIG superfamily endonuclease